MKRIAILFLLLTLFYNVLGYYLMFDFQKEQTWVASMENSSNAKFKVLKLNASVYTFMDDTDLEEVNENITIGNKSYHVFKKKIQNNILSLYYLPSSEGNTVSKDLKDIVDNQLFNSSSSKENPTKKLLKSFLKDYIANENACFECNKTLVQKTATLQILPNKAVLSGYFSSNYPPPDFV
jgi:hypothetical protein